MKGSLYMSTFSSYEKDKKIFDNWRQFVIREQAEIDEDLELTEDAAKTLQELQIGEKYAAVEGIGDIKNVGELLYYLTAKGVLKPSQWDKVKLDIAKKLESLRETRFGKLADFLSSGIVAGLGTAAVATILSAAGVDAETIAAASVPTGGLSFIGLAVLNQAGGGGFGKITDFLFDSGLKVLVGENKEVLAQLIGWPDTGKGKSGEAPLIGLFDLDDDYQALARVFEKKEPSDFSDLEKESLELFIKKIIKASISNLDTTIEKISSDLNHDEQFKDLIKKNLGIDVDKTEAEDSLHMQPNRKPKRPIASDDYFGTPRATAPRKQRKTSSDSRFDWEKYSPKSRRKPRVREARLRESTTSTLKINRN